MYLTVHSLFLKMVSSVQVNKSPGFCPLYKEAEEVQQQCLCPRSSGFVEESKICNRSFSEGTAHKKKESYFWRMECVLHTLLSTRTSHIQDTSLK